jgi:hypothetical protein
MAPLLGELVRLVWESDGAFVLRTGKEALMKFMSASDDN